MKQTKTPAIIGRPPVLTEDRKQSYTVSLTPTVRDYFVSKYGSLTSAMQALIELENQYEVTRLKLAQLAAENREYLKEGI